MRIQELGAFVVWAANDADYQHVVLNLAERPHDAAQVIAPVVAGAMAQATGTFKGALWLTAGVMAAGMVLLATLPQDEQV